MLTPTFQIKKNLIIFFTYLGAICTTTYLLFYPSQFSWFNFQIVLWLWLTVLFSNFAQALAERRGTQQAAILNKTQLGNYARRIENGIEIKTLVSNLKKGDVVICEVGDIVPADGEVIKGIASVDESAITGESAPVIRESGGDLSSVTAGTKVVSDKLVIRVSSEVKNSFLNRLSRQFEGIKRDLSPNEIAMNRVLLGFALIFLCVVVSLYCFFHYSLNIAKQHGLSIFPAFIALFFSLIPTTVSALLNAVAVSGMARLAELNVIAKSGSALEDAGGIELLLLDKTGTITLGNRMATEFLPIEGLSEVDFAKIAQLASFSDETPEGRSIVILAKEKFNLRMPEIDSSKSKFIPFSAQTRMSGIDFFDAEGRLVKTIRKGSPDAIKNHIEKKGGIFLDQLNEIIKSISILGGTPLLVSEDKNIIGTIHLKDVIKGGIQERFSEMQKMGIRTIMITGDNPLTAAAIAAETGIDDFIAEASPEMKLRLIMKEQHCGYSVAMIGDGTNDAPALAQADVGVAMNTGTQTSREAGTMIDLDSNPTKLLQIVKIGKQLLITRGSLMAFSLASSLGKYFAIIPAMIGYLYATQGHPKGPLSILNVMGLHSPKSAILSTLIFNALIILFFIPLAIKGVKYHVRTAHALLKNNLILYGIGGIIAPFVGIKLIDMAIFTLGWV